LTSFDRSRLSADALITVEAVLARALSFTPEEACDGQGAILRHD
jgi:hypothetical protein